MHKLNVNCTCGHSFKVDVDKIRIHKNYFNCSKCNQEYYVKYNGETKQYEVLYVGEINNGRSGDI